MEELPTLYQQQIHITKYSRWRDDLGRRETWPETVDRYMEQIQRQAIKLGRAFTKSEYSMLRGAILNHDVLPSMRALMTAGRALERDNIAAYNCAYVAIDYLRALPEILFILCCGTGVGYSVEADYVDKLPEVPASFRGSLKVIEVRDSKRGWAEAYEELIECLLAGEIPAINYDKVRPAGTPLKTFGGRASGPEPLKALFEYTIEVITGAAGRKLLPIEVHGIICKIGDIVVVGGVRRSALIALFTPEDREMFSSKMGLWWEEHPEFRLANNSVVYDGLPDYEDFKEHFAQLVKSDSGEPGIINRQALTTQARNTGRRDFTHRFGVNPCAEIILRSKQFCNLSTVVLRPSDGEGEIDRKVQLASILGTIQASFTDFRFLGPEWKVNCDEEALIGVSFMGIMDNPLMNGRESGLTGRLQHFKSQVRATNVEWSSKWGINPSAANTCVKPDGNGSQFTGADPGIHGAHDKFIIRRNRASKHDPAAQLMQMMGVPCEDDLFDPERTLVFSWPQKAPDGARTRHDYSAIEHLDLWLTYTTAWCEHKPSITVSVKPGEWDEVRDWVYSNWAYMSGVSFLPWDGGSYVQAPYESITEDQYNELLAQMPDEIDWSLLSALERTDMTEGSKELACVGGSCAI